MERRALLLEYTIKEHFERSAIAGDHASHDKRRIRIDEAATIPSDAYEVAGIKPPHEPGQAAYNAGKLLGNLCKLEVTDPPGAHMQAIAGEVGDHGGVTNCVNRPLEGCGGSGYFGRVRGRGRAERHDNSEGEGVPLHVVPPSQQYGTTGFVGREEIMSDNDERTSEQTEGPAIADQAVADEAIVRDEGGETPTRVRVGTAKVGAAKIGGMKIGAE